MGADIFKTTGKGTTAGEAFNSAVKQARHWYGHDGYTGSIAEKDSFVEIRMPMDIPELTENLKWDFPTRIQNAIFSWHEAMQKAIRGKHYTYIPSDDEIVAQLQNPGTSRQDIQGAKDLIWMMDRLTTRGVRIIAEAHDNKWGDCIAWKSGDDEWTFIGLASC